MRKALLISAVLLTQFYAFAQNWVTVGYRGEFSNAPFGMSADTVNDKLFAWGFFNVDSVSSPIGIAELLNGNDWQYTFSQVNSPARQIVNFQGNYYACPWQGNSGVAKWNGSAWIDAGTPSGGMVYNLYNDGDSILWALGSFSSIASIPANDIAKFNGASWNALDTATWSGVCIREMCRYNGDIYFGGDFFNQAKDIYDITKWDGTLFHKVGNGIHGNIEFVQDLIVYNNELYVGGWFWAGVNGNPGNMIAKWDGTQWYQVGGGMQNGQVNDFEIYNGKLWTAGAFINAGGTTASMVATYDGLDWCDVGTFDISVNDLCVFNNEIYLCGNFQTIDGDSVGHVVKWVGGNNNNGCGHLNTGLMEQSQYFSVQIFPNPATYFITLLGKNISGSVDIQLCDILGQTVIERREENVSGNLNVEIDLRDIPGGIYFVTVTSGEKERSSGKIIIQQ